MNRGSFQNARVLDTSETDLAPGRACQARTRYFTRTVGSTDNPGRNK